MFRVTLHHLSPTAGPAGPPFDPVDLDSVAPAELQSLLERFQTLPPAAEHDADPRILIVAPGGRFLVRHGGGKLYLYNARDATEPYTELSASEIVAHLEHGLARAGAKAETDESGAPPAPTPHRGIAFAILAAGLALNGYTLYSVFYTQPISEPPVVTLLTNAAEIAAHQHDVLGLFTTGSQPGDRSMLVEASGRIHFGEIGAKHSVLDNADTYHIGRHGKSYCLATKDSGVVDVVDIDTLTYYSDTYHRTE